VPSRRVKVLTMPNQQSEKDREAFDRSFEFFQGSDPWGSPDSNRNKALNTTFESDPFEFSAISSVPNRDNDGLSTLFADDPFLDTKPTSGKTRLATAPIATVRVGVHEQISALYDDTSRAGSVEVQGSIHVKLTGKISAPFSLVCRDPLDQIERLDCSNISDTVSRHGMHESDRILRVQISDEIASLAAEGVSIATYTCVPSLHPVPLVSFGLR
jgi:hypothetical protein